MDDTEIKARVLKALRETPLVEDPFLGTRVGYVEVYFTAGGHHFHGLVPGRKAAEDPHDASSPTSRASRRMWLRNDAMA